ncbi:response regulator [Aliifodinibius salipaludis]|nr:response regulator [Aliifodinibius salipaludis]
MNILVVENHRRKGTGIIQMIGKIDLDIENLYQANDGNEGLEILKTYFVDLMLVDIDMLVIDGLEVLGKMRSDTDCSEVPTIVISSRRDMKLFNAVTSSGLGYLHRPFSWRMLRQKILKFKNGDARYVV